MSHIRKVNTDPVSNLMNMLQYKAPGLGNRPDHLCRWFFKKSCLVLSHPPPSKGIHPNPFLDFLSFCRRPPKACTHRFQPASKWLQPQVVLPPPHHQASLTLRRASSILPSSILPSSSPIFLRYDVEQSEHIGGLGSPRYRCQVVFLNTSESWRASGMPDECGWSEWCRSKKEAKRECATLALGILLSGGQPHDAMVRLRHTAALMI